MSLYHLLGTTFYIIIIIIIIILLRETERQWAISFSFFLFWCCNFQIFSNKIRKNEKHFLFHISLIQNVHLWARWDTLSSDIHQPVVKHEINNIACDSENHTNSYLFSYWGILKGPEVLVLIGPSTNNTLCKKGFHCFSDCFTHTILGHFTFSSKKHLLYKLGL